MAQTPQEILFAFNDRLVSDRFLDWLRQNAGELNTHDDDVDDAEAEGQFEAFAVDFLRGAQAEITAALQAVEAAGSTR
ncbi:hypothetical protein [Blastochloris tepida]|uniref:Uncharacterized protein n=1 Tax=Blastochloris tepida TaxID=2233851 RepID=A0A348FXN7_9HYPH|nr:hypothetical protein [Blastochloris tepida]BBF92070.1 hypothetical protein BLTE_07550 [Blastochloris tepida]